ncbi:hypothetical protein thsps117_34520 [Pseudomonas sp. No.117]
MVFAEVSVRIIMKEAQGGKGRGADYQVGACSPPESDDRWHFCHTKGEGPRHLLIHWPLLAWTFGWRSDDLKAANHSLSEQAFPALKGFPSFQERPERRLAIDE